MYKRYRLHNMNNVKKAVNDMSAKLARFTTFTSNPVTN